MLRQRTSSNNGRFTTADLDFISSVLAPEGQRPYLEKLWTDPNALREMLDLKEVFQNLVNSPQTLRVSPRFYFYVLVRHAFLRAKLTHAGLADYVAGVMTRRVSPSPDDPLNNIVGGYTHASEFISLINRSRGKMRFHLQMAAGNQFLLISGLYPDFIKHRSEVLGAPDLEFYESFTQKVFRDAANDSHAASPVLQKLLGDLSDALPIARNALNHMADEFVFLGD
jgi:hypothetical protein